MLNQTNSKKYWVIGGLYRDTGFDTLVEGTERLFGPFPSRDEATQAWRQLAEATRSSCLTRFSIAEEPSR
jgi:hypothetical protein